MRFGSRAYTCLEQLQQNHYFCDQHSWLDNCPVHQNGKIKCEVYRCPRAYRKFTRSHYTCLAAGEFHLFCDFHAYGNCPIHSQGYYTA